MSDTALSMPEFSHGEATRLTDTSAESDDPRARVLFLCTYNAVASQMAEGILRHLCGSQIAVFSAGSAPTSLHPLAVRTLAQRGIAIADQQAKHLSLFRTMTFDAVITLCDCTRSVCPPAVPGRAQQLWPIGDPSLAYGSSEEQSEAFQRTATQIIVRCHHSCWAGSIRRPAQHSVAP